MKKDERIDRLAGIAYMMLGIASFASMDAIGKWLVRDISVFQILAVVVFYIESRRFLIRDSPRPATTYEQKTGGADGVKGA